MRHHRSDVAASASVECITSGAITPATNAVGHAADERLQRRRHAAPLAATRSSTSSVTTGTIIAQPNE